MWENSRYFWVVHCKNHWFHLRKNLFFKHRIPLAETDAVTPRPAIDCRFKAQSPMNCEPGVAAVRSVWPN